MFSVIFLTFYGTLRERGTGTGTSGNATIPTWSGNKWAQKLELFQFRQKETCISQIKLVPCQKHSTFVCLLSHLLALSASFRTAKQDCVFTALLHCRRRSGQRNKSVCLRLFQNRHKTDIQNRHKILFQFLFVPIFSPFPRIPYEQSEQRQQGVTLEVAPARRANRPVQA